MVQYRFFSVLLMVGLCGVAQAAPYVLQRDLDNQVNTHRRVAVTDDAGTSTFADDEKSGRLAEEEVGQELDDLMGFLGVFGTRQVVSLENGASIDVSIEPGPTPDALGRATIVAGEITRSLSQRPSPADSSTALYRSGRFPLFRSSSAGCRLTAFQEISLQGNELTSVFTLNMSLSGCPSEGTTSPRTFLGNMSLPRRMQEAGILDQAEDFLTLDRLTITRKYQLVAPAPAQ